MRHAASSRRGDSHDLIWFSCSVRIQRWQLGRWPIDLLLLPGLNRQPLLLVYKRQHGLHSAMPLACICTCIATALQHVLHALQHVLHALQHVTCNACMRCSMCCMRCRCLAAGPALRSLERCHTSGLAAAVAAQPEQRLLMHQGLAVLGLVKQPV
jgi:hypothetical protein